MAAVEQEAVREQLDRILASEQFVNAGRLCRFLRFAVEAELRGEGSQIKEYLIGREVFDRDDQYDPRLDPIVRVEARRLRSKLAEYYTDSGRNDAIRIEFPKGGYTVTIAPADSFPTAVPGPEATVIVPPPAGRRLTSRQWILMAVLGAVSVGAGIFIWKPQPPGETVAVIPARWIWRETENLEASDEGVAEAVTAELANRGAARAIGWPEIRRRKGTNATQLGADRTMVISVRPAGSQLRVTVFLLNGPKGTKDWVTDLFRPTLKELPAQQEVAARIVDEFLSRRKKAAS